MTGFGRGTAKNDSYEVTTEIKSVNHRYKDFRFRMSSLFNALEIPLRQELEKNFKRGSFDISINYRQEKTSSLKAALDYEKINHFLSTFKNNIAHQDSTLTINPTDFLRNEFYTEDEKKEDVLAELVMGSFTEAILNLKSSREVEGQKLVEVLLSHRDEFDQHFKKIIQDKDEYEKSVKDKIGVRFKEENLDAYLEEPRFYAEVIYYLEKLNVDEEINRIKTHESKLAYLINEKKSEIGRELDFLMQELNRETNTIGSKSGSESISNSVIKMKVELEKIREQALNLE